jgi:HEAT repeat protein
MDVHAQFAADYDAALSELEHETTSRILAIIRDYSQPASIRVAAIHQLARLQVGKSQKVEVLLQAASASHLYVASMALWALGQLGDNRVCSQIREKMLNGHVDTALRGDCLITLGTLGDSSIYPDCEDAISSGPRSERLKAAVALSELGTPKALSLLQSCLFLKDQPLRRGIVACLLARHKVTAGEADLCAELERKTDTITTLISAAALANLANPAGIKALRDLILTWDDREVFKIATVMMRATDISMDPKGDVKEQVLSWLASKTLG